MEVILNRSPTARTSPTACTTASNPISTASTSAWNNS